MKIHNSDSCSVYRGHWKSFSRTFVCLMKNGWKVEQNLQFSDVFELFSFGFCLFLSHFLFPEYANAEQSVTSHQASDVERSNLFSCFYWLDLQTYSVCVDVSQQPLGDNSECWTGPGAQTFQTQTSSCWNPTCVSTCVSMLQTGIESFLLLETSQSKGKMKEKSVSWFSGNVQILCSIINQDE